MGFSPPLFALYHRRTNKVLTIKRVCNTPQGIFGVLLGNDSLPICVTLENTWRDNAINISCIPFGRYICYKHLSHKFKIETYKVNQVPNRTHIIFHPGNTARDTLGCILLGTSFTEFNTAFEDSPVAERITTALIPGISESVLAHKRFMESTDGLESFILEIRE